MFRSRVLITEVLTLGTPSSISLALSRRYHCGIEPEEIFAVILVVVETSNRNKAAVDPSIVSPIVEMEKSYKITLPSFNCSVDTADNSQTTMLNENSCDKLTTSITGIAPQEIFTHTPFTAPMNKSYTLPISRRIPTISHQPKPPLISPFIFPAFSQNSSIAGSCSTL